MKLIKYFLIFAITFSFLTQEKISAQTDNPSEYTVEEILVTARKEQSLFKMFLLLFQL